MRNGSFTSTVIVGCTISLLAPGPAAARPADVAAAREAAEKPAADTPGGNGPQDPLLAQVPREYRSGADPLASTEIASNLRRAEEHFLAQRWSRGLAVLDELLETLSSARPRKIPRKSSKAGAKAPGNNAAQVAGVAGGLVPAAAGGDDNGEGDQEPDVTPQEEVATYDGILYRPVAAAVRGRLLELPAGARDTARRTYEAPARKALEGALALSADRAPAALRRVADRYPLTPSGADALLALAERLLGSGRFAGAAAAFETRAKVLPPAEGALRATALAQAALAHLLAGAPARAGSLLEEIRRAHSEETIRLRGEPVRAGAIDTHPFFQALLKKAGAAAAGPASDPRAEDFAWSSTSGRFDRAGLAFRGDSVPEGGSQARWILPLDDLPPPEKGRVAPRPSGLQPAGAGGVSLGSRVFVRRAGSELVALGARTGKRIWRAFLADLDTGGTPATAAIRRTVPGAVSSSALCPTLFRPAAGRRALVVGIDKVSGIGRTRDGRLTYTPNLLAAFDARSGKLVWKARARVPAGGKLRDAAFTAAPAVCGDRLVTTVRRGQSAYAVALSAGGKTVWLRRLYTVSVSPYMRYGIAAAEAPSPAVSQNTVVVAPGQGVACALEARTGELRWVSRYRTLPPRSYVRSGAGGAPPALVDGKVIIAPADSTHVTTLDAYSGRILWEHPLTGTGPNPSYLLGVGSGRVYTAGKELQALDLSTGAVLWSSKMTDPASGRGIVAADQLIVPVRGGGLAWIDSRTGKIERRLRWLDPRLLSGPACVFLARGEILAATPRQVFALRPQQESWKNLAAEEGRDPFRRVRLLQAEGRYDEAIAALDALLSELKSKEALARARKDLVAVAREAASVTGEARFIAALLSRKEPAVKERKDVLALRLLEAKYLEDEAAGKERDADKNKPPAARPAHPAGPERRREALSKAVQIYFELSALDGVQARSPEGLEVDVGVYASDSLRILRSQGADVQNAAAETRVRAYLLRHSSGAPSAAGESAAAGGAPAETGPDPDLRLVDSRALASVLVRNAHLKIAADACLELVRRALLNGDRDAAEQIASLGPAFEGPLKVDDAASLQDVLRATGAPESLLETARRAVGRDRDSVPPPTPGLDRILAASKGQALSQRFWIAGEESFLVMTARGSEPLAGVLVLAGNSLQVHNTQGDIVFTRELPGYPDVSDAKASLQSHIEEPAYAHRAGSRLLLLTPAGIYCFAVSSRPGDLRLRWVSHYPHPLARETASNARRLFFGGGVSIPSGKNFFAEFTFDDAGRPVTLLPDGTLFCIEPRTGKYRWYYGPTGERPLSAPHLDGPWIEVMTASPPGIHVFPAPDAPAPRITGPHIVKGKRGLRRKGYRVDGPPKGLSSGFLLSGRLFAFFSGSRVQMLEAGTHRTLWQGGTRLGRSLLTRRSAVWFAGRDGKITARSIRSGRKLNEIELSPGGVVLGSFFDPRPEHETGAKAGPEHALRAATFVVCAGASAARGVYYSGRSSTGAGLRLVRLRADGTRVWESSLHDGAVTYSQGGFLSPDGDYLLVFNAEMETEKWYTRVFRVARADGKAQLLASVELKGRGTGQPPRLAVVKGGLAIGSADGFGWFAPPVAAHDAPRGDEKARGNPK